jgi:hypothetical protein
MLHSLFNWLARRRQARRAVPLARRNRFAPGIEALEDRSLPSTTLIGGSVFQDLNNNGLRDVSEAGIANNPIQLQRPDGSVIAQTATDGNGNYLFSQDQTVDATPKTITHTAILAPTTTNTTSTLTVDQFDGSLGQLLSVDLLINGKLVSQVKVESLDASPSTIKTSTQGSLTIQAPGANLNLQLANSDSADLAAADGTIDFQGASGHDFGQKSNTGSKSATLTSGTDDLSPFIGTGKVTLSATSQVATNVSGPGNFVSQASAQASGSIQVVYHYKPDNSLKPGQYVVHQAQQPDGYFKGLNTGDNVTPIPNSTTSYDIPVTLGANGQSLQNNFAELKPASVSGFAYLDNNNDGIKDPGEAPIAGTTVHLLENGTQLAQTLTAADGSYSFNNLPPGSYTLKEDPQPQYLDGKATPGSLGGTSAIDQLFVNLKPGDVGLKYNFAQLVPSTTPPGRPPDTGGGTPGGGTGETGTPPPLTKLLFIGGDWWKMAT